MLNTAIHNQSRIIRAILQMVRPSQWLKNILLLFPPFFGGKPWSCSQETLLPLISFSLAASAIYIINDIFDRSADRIHPRKKQRAIARGDITAFHSGIIAVTLYVYSMLLAAQISERFQGYLILYLVLTFLYTTGFKHIYLLDMFAIASGYVLRVLAGGEAYHVAVSSWLFLAVFIVALFLAAGKRLGELIEQGEQAAKHRQILNEYSAPFLEGVLWFSASASLVAYALYVIENREAMLYTVPVAAYGLLRYIYVVKRGKGDPTDVLLSDKHIMITGLIWVAMVGLMIYR